MKKEEIEVSAPEPRPNTIEPDPTQVIEVGSEYLAALTDEQLAQFCSDYLGVAPKPGTTRDRLLTLIMGCALEARDG